MTSAEKNIDFYPPIEPFDTGFLKVSSLHTLYYEQCGNKTGNPIVFVHGGPGGGVFPDDKRFFDPKAYRVIVFHQRGCGKSTPSAELKENTTWHSVKDIETLREHLGIEKWVVFGGSWGSALSLAYAQTHPERVKSLILRGIFTLRRSEREFIYEGKGTNFIFPEFWEEFANYIPEAERGAIIDAYYRRLTSDDENTRKEAAIKWVSWMLCIPQFVPNVKIVQMAKANMKWVMEFARVGCHYMVNGGFFSSDSYLLDNIDKIRHIPCSFVQGRYDVVCPMITAWELHKRWPEAEFVIADDSGHTAMEKTTKINLLKFCDKYKNL